MSITYKFIFGALFLGIVVVGGYHAWMRGSSDNLANLSSDSKLTDDQVAQLVGKIGAFLVLPTDEKPSVAVIHDVAQLAGQQSFYKDAKDGDILVLYSSRAIIYDAKTNKLVNVGPIVRNDNPAVSASPVASGSATVTPSPSVAAKAIKIDVRNGTATAGLAGVTASDLKKNALFTIGVVGDAKGTYKETVVVDLSKDAGKSAAAAQLATYLKAKVVTALPTGEATTTADVLVILGK